MRSELHRRLLRAGRGAVAAGTTAVVVGLLTAVLAVAHAGLLAHAIASAFQGGADIAALTPTLVALAAVLAARAGLGWAAEVAAQRTSAAVKADLRSRVLAAAVARGPRLATERSTAQVTLLATRGLDALDGYFGRYLPQVALAAIVPVVVVGCLLAVDLVAALTVAFTAPLIPVFMVLVGQRSAALRDRRWATLERLANRFADVVAGLPTLRAYGRADAQVGTLRRTTAAYRAATLETLRVAFLSALALELLATISVAMVAVGIGLRLVEGTLALETGLFALILAPEAYLPLRRLGAEFHASEEGLAAAREAFALIDEASSDRPTPPSAGWSAAPTTVAAIVVDGVAVEQPGREVVAPAGASFEARAGEIVAVTGESGAGKSTLLAVLLGLTSPTSGRVEVVDESGRRAALAELDPAAWRHGIAWVPQRPFLFAGSVADNLRVAAPDATDDAVTAALDTVGLRDVGPSRVVGEGGRGLSGGQRRRVGVARALLRRSSVLLLDEPTAGLDADAEARIMAALRAEADRGALVVVAAHRPGAIAVADRTVEVRWASVEGTAGAMSRPVAAGVRA